MHTGVHPSTDSHTITIAITNAYNTKCCVVTHDVSGNVLVTVYI